MKHLGDIKKIKNAPFVDCITFGSPCQDLSIAGKRVGLAGERSGLFMEAVRIIKEMRKQSGGLYPTFAVWENVPGAFSSNKGEDFRAVLEELGRIGQADVSVPRPENGKWAKAGFICGNGWSIAWRTFDAQFWGVPQRRRRIAVVVDFGGQRAGEILFERTGVSGNLEPSIPTWKGIARNPAHGSVRYDRVVERKEPILLESNQNHATVQTNGICTALPASMGMGGGYVPMVCLQGNMIDRDVKQNGSGIAESETMFTLNATDRHGVCCAAFTAGQSAHTDMFGTCKAVFESHSQDARYTQQGDTSPACTAQWGTGGNNMPLVAFAKEAYNTGVNASCSFGIESTDIAPTLRADTHPSGVAYKALRWIVRRLTPIECERLQGFPDGWTDIGEWVDSKGNRRKPADSPRYKALGNSIALPQWWWLTCKLAAYLPDHATLGSLFDGIGGFPLVWETRHGKGTAVWASEIEEFPIAVTKKHFGDGKDG